MKQPVVLILLVLMVLSFAACGGITSSNSSEVSIEETGLTQPVDNKGSIDNPYSSTDTFLIKAFDVVPMSHLSPEGRQVKKPITFKISNVRVLYPHLSYVDREGEHNNGYLIAFECEIKQSEVNNTITGDYYLWLRNLSTDNQVSIQIGGPGDVYDLKENSPGVYPDECIPFSSQGIMPVEGASWHFADVIYTQNDGELAYIYFHYFGEDAEEHEIYVKVDIG